MKFIEKQENKFEEAEIFTKCTKCGNFIKVDFKIGYQYKRCRHCRHTFSFKFVKRRTSAFIRKDHDNYSPKNNYLF